MTENLQNEDKESLEKGRQKHTASVCTPMKAICGHISHKCHTWFNTGRLHGALWYRLPASP